MAKFPFTIFDDALNESTESFTIAYADGEGDIQYASVTILDDDSFVEVSVSGQTVNESEGFGVFHVSAFSEVTGANLLNDLEVTYTVLDTVGSAERGVDYVLADGTVTIPAGIQQCRTSVYDH